MPQRLARGRARAGCDSNRSRKSARVDTNRVARAGESRGSNIERFAPVTAQAVRFTVEATTDAEPCIDELEVYTAGSVPRNVALATTGTTARASSIYPNSDIHRLEHINDGKHGNSRSWISNERGKGWVELEFPETRHDRTHRLGPRPRAEIHGSARDGVSHRSRRRIERLARGCFFRGSAAVRAGQKATAERVVAGLHRTKRRREEAATRAQAARDAHAPNCRTCRDGLRRHVSTRSPSRRVASIVATRCSRAKRSRPAR